MNQSKKVERTNFPCVVCGCNAPTFTTTVCKHYTRRVRVCPNGHGFKTYQNGHGEIFDCFVIPDIDRNGPQYRQMKRTYNTLAAVCEIYGNDKIAWCLERARQRAGVMREGGK